MEPLHLSPIPFNETFRLRALRSLNVLDTPPMEELDRVTRLAQRYFGVPIALVSLVDENRQWFKSSQGLEVSETPRDISFCAHTIMGDDLMEVTDAAADPRFADGPLVTADPWIRYYAGVPLITADGFHLGSFCIIDCKPRPPLCEEGREVLRDFAAIALKELVSGAAPRDRETEPLAVNVARHPAGPNAATDSPASDAQHYFLAALTHELRTPLNAILGFSEAISEEVFGPLENEKYRSYGAHIQESGEHLLSLVNTILDFEKVRSGEFTLEEDRFDLSEAARYCETLFAEDFRRAGAAFYWSATSWIPALNVDGQQVKQMLINLVGNSLKFTDEGGAVSLTAGLRPDGGVTLAVSDTGIGIAAADIEKALAPFGQIDNAQTRRHKGTGLGLALTKQLIELHGGSLEIDSDLGIGTTIRLHFPHYRNVSAPPPSYALAAV